MVVQRLFVVIRRYGPPYARDLPLEAQQDWEAHRAFMNALEAEGLVRLGGPLEEREDVLLIFRGKHKEEIERRLADDPWTKRGILSTARISGWNLRIGEVAQQPADRASPQSRNPRHWREDRRPLFSRPFQTNTEQTDDGYIAHGRPHRRVRVSFASAR